MIRFLAADLDGTLLTTSKTITPCTQKVLVEAQQQGLTVILASGRPLYSILPFAEQLELQKHRGFIISFNGSLVWDCAKGKALNEQVIPLSIIPQLVAAVGEDFHIHGYKGNSIVIAEVGDLFYMFHGDVTYCDAALKANKLSIVFEDKEAARETLNRVREFVGAHPTVYLSTHCPEGYENLEMKRVMKL